MLCILEENKLPQFKDLVGSHAKGGSVRRIIRETTLTTFENNFSLWWTTVRRFGETTQMLKERSRFCKVVLVGRNKTDREVALSQS